MEPSAYTIVKPGPEAAMMTVTSLGGALDHPPSLLDDDDGSLQWSVHREFTKPVKH